MKTVRIDTLYIIKA